MYILSIVGLLIVSGAWLHYLALIPKEKVPKHPNGHKAMMGLGAVVSILGAPALPYVGAALMVVSVILAFFFVYLLREAPLPKGELGVSVGDPLLPFEAQLADGSLFSSESLKGRRLLFKFFRGHW